MANLAHRSLAGGEIAPALYARTDAQKYATAVRTMRNFYVQRHGGAANRPGFLFVAEVADSSSVQRLMRFVFNAEQTYVLLFGDRTLRFIREGSYISAVQGGVILTWLTAVSYEQGTYREHGGDYYVALSTHTSGATTEPGVGSAWQGTWHLLDGTIYEIPTPYLEADLAAIQYVQSADVVTLVHPSYPPHELRRYAHNRWVLEPIVFGPTVGLVSGIGHTGGAAGTIRYWIITAVSEDGLEEGLGVVYSSINAVPASGTPTILTWVAAPGALSYNVYRSDDGATYGYIGTSGGIPSLTTDSSFSDATETATSVTSGVLGTAAGQVRNDVIAAVADKPYDQKATVNFTMEVTGTGTEPVEVLGTFAIYYKRDAETRVLAAEVPANLTGAGSTGAVPYSQVIDVPDNGYTTLQIDIVPRVLGTNGGGATSFSAIATGTSVTWNKLGTGFSDVGDDPDFLTTPPTQPIMFASADNFPRTATYSNQRLYFGGTNNEPETVWGSRVAKYHNFTLSSPIRDNDPLSFTLVGRQVNEIRFLLELDGLMVFTAGEEKVVEGDESGILRPGAINVRGKTYHGCDELLSPINIGDSVVFIQARGAIARDFGYDGGRYLSRDLSLYAAHMLEGHEVVSSDYAQSPHSIIYFVRSDGTMLGLTYLPNESIWGWHRHDTMGTIEQVVCVPEGDEDRIYVVVLRDIDGVPKRYVERLASRYITVPEFGHYGADAVFADSAVVYDGRNTGVITLSFTSGTWAAGVGGTLTASASHFVIGDIGAKRMLWSPTENRWITLSISGYTNVTTVSATPDFAIPVPLRGVPTLEWAVGKTTIEANHLDGEPVSIVADGAVLASPFNPDYDDIPATGGAVAIGRTAAQIVLGLPYLSDIETLDIDTVSGKSVMPQAQLVGKLGLYVEKSRGVFAGIAPPVDDDTDATSGLHEMKDLNPTPVTGAPVLRTEFVEVGVEGRWNSYGRVFVRQVDPLPLTILSITPQGYLMGGR